MSVLAVKAALISSSAFFIEAAANSVSALSSAQAGGFAAPHKIARVSKDPASRCIRALHAYPGAPIAQGGVGDRKLRFSGSAVLPIPLGLRPKQGYRRLQHNRPHAPVKGPIRIHDRDRPIRGARDDGLIGDRGCHKYCRRNRRGHVSWLTRFHLTGGAADPI